MAEYLELMRMIVILSVTDAFDVSIFFIKYFFLFQKCVLDWSKQLHYTSSSPPLRIPKSSTTRLVLVSRRHRNLKQT